MNPQRSPIQQLKQDQSSFLSQAPYRQTQFNYAVPKIDHAYIVENYRRLRIQQRDQLAKLRMPEDIKRKIFDFKQDQDLKHDKPDLLIFNHPFRGKMVLTRNEVEKQLERERKNAQIAEDFEQRGQKVPQNIFNEMGLQEDQISLKMTKMARQTKQREQEYPRKPRLVSNQPQRKIAQQINKQQQKRKQDKIYFIHKSKEKQETESEKNQKMQHLIEQKQSKSKIRNNQYDERQLNDKSRSKQKRQRFSDMPIIGQQPRVVRDINFDSGKNLPSNKNIGKPQVRQDSGKKFYRPFENDHQIRQFQKNPVWMNKNSEGSPRLGSGQGLIKKRALYSNNHYVNPNDKSISEISAIQSNDNQDELSNSQSLNKALFMD